MNKSKLIKLLKILHISDILSIESIEGIEAACETKIYNICAEIKLDPKTLLEELPTNVFNPSDNTSEWKYVCISLYLLDLLLKQLAKKDMLSVEDTQIVNETFRNLFTIGVCRNVHKNLPLHKNFSRTVTLSGGEQIASYRRLAGTLHEVMRYLKTKEFVNLIVPQYLKVLLVSFYQMLYCPLKEPASEPVGSFVMTPQLYESLVRERKVFEDHFEYFKSVIYRPTYVRETMLLLETSSPKWFKKALTENLNAVFFSDKGIQHVAAAMFDDSTDDSTKTWKSLDVISKLVLSCRHLPDFKEKICKQIIDLLHLKSVPKIYERVFVVCTKKLYLLDKKVCEETFLQHMWELFMRFTNKKNFTDREDVTKVMEQAVKLYHACFVDGTIDLPPLPISIITPTVLILMRFFTNLGWKLDITFDREMKQILVKYFENCDTELTFEILDAYFFAMNPKHFPDIKDLEFSDSQKIIIVKHLDYTPKPCMENGGAEIMNISRNNTTILNNLFTYLLNCLVEYDKYFKCDNSSDLLHIESEATIPESVDRRFLVLKLLFLLAEDKTVQCNIRKNPTDVVKYVKSVLNKTIDSQLHIKEEEGSNTCQTIFTVLQILETLILSSAKRSHREAYETLCNPLARIGKETTNKELKEYTRKILKEMQGRVEEVVENAELTELEAALGDLYDPLVPVRGHALMALTKLIERKDRQAMERKQYILNVFQQNLKDEDSYIYLSAIRGLSAMCDSFPDTVLSVLTEEYSEFGRKDTDDGHEVRMKLGEVLVRVTALLGEMAPKYKALLLNTFLTGAKDEDHLIRASSLSNLGEVCRVLGYKLGTIANEVLACVHAIITSDKAPEARRAAVTVIRQLFIGLEKETIAFLKGEILPIYRTLKDIYNNDSDDVMKLQAQLALEELNENVRSFVFPEPQLGGKIFVLK